MLICVGLSTCQNGRVLGVKLAVGGISDYLLSYLT
jgi:hypothetical protein